MNTASQQTDNKSKTAVIMQARVGSTRLPAKVLKTICGKTVLEHDIERCLRIKRSSGVIIATTIEPDSYKIVEICEKFSPEEVSVHRGSVEDVLGRYYDAARRYKVRYVIRITSDCPLLDFELADSMIGKFIELRGKKLAIDLLFNNNPPTFPHGLDMEIFTFEALEKAFNEANDQDEREHVTPYIRCHPELFKMENFSQTQNLSHLRWTLDYPEDFEFIKAVYEHLYPQNPVFATNDILTLLENHPEIQAINEGRRQR